MSTSGVCSTSSLRHSTRRWWRSSVSGICSAAVLSKALEDVELNAGDTVDLGAGTTSAAAAAPVQQTPHHCSGPVDAHARALRTRGPRRRRRGRGRRAFERLPDTCGRHRCCMCLLTSGTAPNYLAKPTGSSEHMGGWSSRSRAALTGLGPGGRFVHSEAYLYEAAAAAGRASWP